MQVSNCQVTCAHHDRVLVLVLSSQGTIFTHNYRNNDALEDLISLISSRKEIRRRRCNSLSATPSRTTASGVSVSLSPTSRTPTRRRQQSQPGAIRQHNAHKYCRSAPGPTWGVLRLTQPPRFLHNTFGRGACCDCTFELDRAQRAPSKRQQDSAAPATLA
jgi:hypothetical protein